MVTLNADQLVLVEEDTPAAKLHFCAYLLCLIVRGPRAIRLIRPSCEGLRDGVDSSQGDPSLTAVEPISDVLFPTMSFALDLVFADEAPASSARSFCFIVGGNPLKVDVETASADASDSITLRIHDADRWVTDAEKLLDRYATLMRDCPYTWGGDTGGRGPIAGRTYLCPTSNRKLKRKRLLAQAPFHLLIVAWFGWWAALACAAYQRRELGDRFGLIGLGVSAVIGLGVAKLVPVGLNALLLSDRFAGLGKARSRRSRAMWFGVGLLVWLGGVVAFGLFVEWAVGPNREFGSLGWIVKASVLMSMAAFALIGLVGDLVRWLRRIQPGRELHAVTNEDPGESL